jgi:hypothetical protein
MHVLHRDVPRLLFQQLFQILSTLVRHVAELLHMELQALLQQAANARFVVAGAVLCLFRDDLEQAQYHVVVRDGTRGVGARRLRRGAGAQALGAVLRDGTREGAQAREQDFIAGDLGIELLDAVVARLALLVDVALLPSARRGVGLAGGGWRTQGWEGEVQTYRMRDFLSTLGWPSMSESSESWVVSSVAPINAKRANIYCSPRVDPTLSSSEASWWKRWR